MEVSVLFACCRAQYAYRERILSSRPRIADFWE
jgi:hypothetical protein